MKAYPETGIVLLVLSPTMFQAYGLRKHWIFVTCLSIVAKNIPKYCIGSVSSHSATPVYQTADWAAGYTTGTLYTFY